ncbi:phosphatase PAP2 family protein [Methylobacterium sp. J-043]|nr:phosphatase PAP2 family protein [Methylobacterium sp. J-043]
MPVPSLFTSRVADAAGPSLATYSLLVLSGAAALYVQSLTGVWLSTSGVQWLAPLSMLAGAVYFNTRAIRPRFGAALALLAVLIVQLPITSALAYGVQAFSLPLRDDWLLRIDRAFGFDWPSFQAAMVERSGLMEILGRAYETFFMQLALAPLILAALGAVRRADRFVAAFILCVMATTLVSAVLPAEGAAGLLGPDRAHLLFQGATPLGDLHALRAGSLRAVALEAVGPLISFPSLHCAVAYLVTAALWPLRALRWAVLALNAVMTVSAVTHGAHYACDCAAGLLVAAVSFHAAGRLGVWSDAALGRMRGAAGRTRLAGPDAAAG